MPEVELRVDGVNATFRHRDAVDEAVRASARRVSELRPCRDGINAGTAKFPLSKFP